MNIAGNFFVLNCVNTSKQSLVFLAAWVSWLANPWFANAAPWVTPDWVNQEPTFPPGSLYWQTGKYATCPVLFRRIIPVSDRPVAYASFASKVSEFGYVFLNGKQIAAVEPRDGKGIKQIEVEFANLLHSGTNVLMISTKGDGFSLDGGISYEGGKLERFATGQPGWKAQKFAPLTMLEYEPCMQAQFDDKAWFAMRESTGEATELTTLDLQSLCQRVAKQRLTRLDEEAKWRLQMLAQKGIAIVDWETHGWGGAQRLPAWLLKLAAVDHASDTPGGMHTRAEALCRYVLLSEEALNLENHALGLSALAAPASERVACMESAQAMQKILAPLEESLKSEKFAQALALASEAERISKTGRQGKRMNDLNRCSDNKFGWFDSPAVLDSDPADWGLELGPATDILTGALSPAALVTSKTSQFFIRGWDKLQPVKVYNKQKPALGPVCAWAVLGGKITQLTPDNEGLVYDTQVQGKLSENWILLANDMSRGGDLPIQLVFLNAPTRISFQAGEKGTREVVINFVKTEVQLFLLRPFKEWRGLLEMAEALAPKKRSQSLPDRYVEQCRLWSRAVLDYPVTFTEVALPDAQERGGLRIADVYNYRTFQDEWGTRPLRLASLPPLTTYGLLCNYPGLKIVSATQMLGWRGLWGDHLAAKATNCVVYRIPLDAFKRFAGFTSYCYGPTDIGEPGSLKEIESIKRTGANSFRPQHNNSGKRAMDTVNWCWAQGLQQMFNADEKWVPDIVEHFRSLAKQYKDFPSDAVAYDLLNEPETRDPRAYRALIRKITNAIREHDQTHLIYVEAMPPWGPGAAPFPRAAFESLLPTGDPKTIYSFHDYQYRLEPRWPNEKNDARAILTRWIPAFRFGIEQRVPLHLGEFGGFEQTRESVFTNPCALILMMDYLNIFDQFDWHWNYYANRGICRIRKDGSLAESFVQEACRRYFSRGTFNANWHAVQQQ